MTSEHIAGRFIVVAMAAFLAAALGLTFVALADASTTWLVLVLGAICSGAAVFWFRNLDNVLLFMFVATVSIDMSKALIVQGGIYSPGLSVYLSDIFFLPLLMKWLWQKLMVERRLPRLDRLQAFSLLFIAWLWLTAAISEDALAGVLAAITYTKYFLMYWVISDMVRSEARLKLLLLAFASTLLVHLVYAFAQFTIGAQLEIQGVKPTPVGVNLVFEGAGGLNVFRPSGFLSHPNVLADYLVFVLPCAAVLVVYCRKSLGRAWSTAAALALGSLVVLVLTLSRGGWIACVAALTALVYLGLRRRMIEGRHVVAALGSMAVILAAISIVYPAAYLRITESDQRSSEARWAMMSQALLIIERNPILGVGFGGYNRAAQNNIPEAFSHLSTSFQRELLKGVVHNKYLLVASEHGLIGLALFLALIWRHLSLFSSVGRWHDRIAFAFALGLTGAIVGQSVFYLFDHFYLDVRVEMLWLAFGILHGIVRMQRRTAAVHGRRVRYAGAAA